MYYILVKTEGFKKNKKITYSLLRSKVGFKFILSIHRDLCYYEIQRDLSYYDSSLSDPPILPTHNALRIVVGRRQLMVEKLELIRPGCEM